MQDRQIQVLLVEDNAVDARLLELALRSTRYGRFSVTHALRLADALARIQQDPFDVVLLDLGLPDSQGLATLQRIRTEANHLPVVVLTGLSDEDAAVHALQQGAEDYLIKGEVDANIIARAIRYTTERKAAEDAIRKSEERLQLAVDAAQIGIWDRDLISGRATWSDHQLQIFGLTRDQHDGSHECFERCIHPDDRAAVRKKIESARATGHAYQQEYRVVWPDSSTHWIEDRGQVRFDHHGRAVRMIGTVMDITARKLAEKSD